MSAARPLYETPANLESEAEVIRRLEAKWKATAIKLPIAYKLDYAFCRDEHTATSIGGAQVQRFSCKALCEVKVRRYTWEQLHALGGFAISLAKWTAAEAFCSVAEIPFVMAVSAAGDIRYASIRTFEHEGVIHGGRADRGDWQDKEPMVLLGVDRFTSLTRA